MKSLAVFGSFHFTFQMFTKCFLNFPNPPKDGNWRQPRATNGTPLNCHYPIFTACKRSCGKECFYTCHSAHRGFAFPQCHGTGRLPQNPEPHPPPPPQVDPSLGRPPLRRQTPKGRPLPHKAEPYWNAEYVHIIQIYHQETMKEIIEQAQKASLS